VKMMRVLLGKDPVVEQRRIVVDLSDQRAVMYDSSGLELFKTAISTGRKGFATPTGTYAITNKYRVWTSTLYDASRPFFQRLSCGDFGFHQGNVPGYPASHGCIRVPAGNAQKFFALTELGDRVEIQP
jgi:lipoprotein-anchoring transpeptidase ErfK/SrfK